MEKYILKDKKLHFLSKKLGIMFSKERYRRGVILQAQNKPMTTLYIISRGKVEFTQKFREKRNDISEALPINPYKDVFYNRRLLIGEEGQIVNDDGIISDRVAAYSVKALSWIEVYQISIKKLRDVCRDNVYIEAAVQDLSLKKIELMDMRLSDIKKFGRPEISNIIFYKRLKMVQPHQSNLLNEKVSRSNGDGGTGGTSTFLEKSKWPQNSMITAFNSRNQKIKGTTSISRNRIGRKQIDNDFCKYLISSHRDNRSIGRVKQRRKGSTLQDQRNFLDQKYSEEKKIVKRVFPGLNSKRSRTRSQEKSLGSGYLGGGSNISIKNGFSTIKLRRGSFRESEKRQGLDLGRNKYLRSINGLQNVSYQNGSTLSERGREKEYEGSRNASFRLKKRNNLISNFLKKSSENSLRISKKKKTTGVGVFSTQKQRCIDGLRKGIVRSSILLKNINLNKQFK